MTVSEQQQPHLLEREEPPAPAPRKRAPGELPRLSLPPAPFTGSFGGQRLDAQAVADGITDPTPPAQALEHQSVFPGSQPAASRRLALPEFDVVTETTGGERRSAPRKTPDRRKEPRSYASPWMARPDGKVDPRPLHEPQPASQLIRPLDASVPALPTDSGRGASDASNASAERSLLPEAPAATVAQSVAPPPHSAPAAEHQSPAVAPSAEPHVSPAVAPAIVNETASPQMWYPGHAEPQTEPAPSGDPLAAIYGNSDNGRLAPVAAVPAAAMPGMPADVRSAAARPAAWFETAAPAPQQHGATPAHSAVPFAGAAPAATPTFIAHATAPSRVATPSRVLLSPMDAPTPAEPPAPTGGGLAAFGAAIVRNWGQIMLMLGIPAAAGIGIGLLLIEYKLV